MYKCVRCFLTSARLCELIAEQVCADNIAWAQNYLGSSALPEEAEPVESSIDRHIDNPVSICNSFSAFINTAIRIFNLYPCCHRPRRKSDSELA
jgi:hypothetical protein